MVLIVVNLDCDGIMLKIDRMCVCVCTCVCARVHAHAHMCMLDIGR